MLIGLCRRFGNVTNGSKYMPSKCSYFSLSCLVTPRRWLDQACSSTGVFVVSLNHQYQCNPGLSKLITETLNVEKSVWLKDLTRLDGLLDYVEDEDFREDWAAVKQANKERLAHHMQVNLSLRINTQAMFDVQIKVSWTRSIMVLEVLSLFQRLHEYKVRVQVMVVFEHI
jgi:starch phosphorylase